MQKLAPLPGENPYSNIASRPGAEAFLVVAIGASAGGLDACRKFLSGLPAKTGMAFILVQHLDPTHASMLVELLAGHSSLKVCEATDGAPVELEPLYVIPPGVSLSVSRGSLRLSEPEAQRGARLPFDFLLQSLSLASWSPGAKPPPPRLKASPPGRGRSWNGSSPARPARISPPTSASASARSKTTAQKS